MDELTLPNHTADILIVDDQARNLDALETVLARPDYNIVRANSGAEALKHVMERDFAVILMDVMMPDFDGFECAKLIKQRWQSRETPVIFVTAVAYDLNFIFMGYSAGAVDYITKPLEPAVVKAKVAVFVELFRKTHLLKLQLEQMRKICQTLETEVIDGKRDIAMLSSELRHFIRGVERRLDDFDWQRTGWKAHASRLATVPHHDDAD